MSVISYASSQGLNAGGGGVAVEVEDEASPAEALPMGSKQQALEEAMTVAARTPSMDLSQAVQSESLTGRSNPSLTGPSGRRIVSRRSSVCTFEDARLSPPPGGEDMDDGKD